MIEEFISGSVALNKLDLFSLYITFSAIRSSYNLITLSNKSLANCVFPIY